MNELELREKIKPILGWRPPGQTTLDQTNLEALEKVWAEQLDALLHTFSLYMESVIGKDDELTESFSLVDKIKAFCKTLRKLGLQKTTENGIPKLV
mgnify:FL=1